MNAVRFISALMLLSFLLSAPAAADRASHVAVKNSWRGITPLRSSPRDVAEVVGAAVDTSDTQPIGPYRVDGGEVTFSYLTPTLAKMYHAPRAMVGTVFTVYFRPDERQSREELKLAAGFKRCTEAQSRMYYYMVSDSGIAYQLRRDNDTVETIIYQPSRAEVSRLAVNTECVF